MGSMGSRVWVILVSLRDRPDPVSIAATPLRSLMWIPHYCGQHLVPPGRLSGLALLRSAPRATQDAIACRRPPCSFSEWDYCINIQINVSLRSSRHSRSVSRSANEVHTAVPGHARLRNGIEEPHENKVVIRSS